MKILNAKQIEQKIKRLSIEILEENYGEEEIILAGINNNGYAFAKMLMEPLEKIASNKVTLARITLNPADPLKDEINFSLDYQDYKNKVIIIVDDVANTGRTIFYAFKPVMDILPAKVEVAVLVDRKHKSFPINVDYVGLSLATTLKENIDVKILKVEEAEVCLS